MKNRSRYFLSFLILIPPDLLCAPVLANQNNEVQGLSGGLTMWITAAFLAGLVTGALLIYLYSRSKIYSILSGEKKKYLHDLEQDERQDPIFRIFFQYIGIVGLLKKSKDKKVNAIDNLNGKISKLRAQNEKLKREYRKGPGAVPGQDVEYDVSSTDETEDNFNNKEKYFTIPENDGSFKNINSRKVKEADCFYKIELNDDCQSGKLHFLTGDYDLRALDNIDYYLSPVCEIQNISERSKARRIQMTGTGSVIKKGDNWIFDGKEKVKIKLV
ncbi:MAG: hypothetical protein ACM3RX_00485 [Methanococcaceae archaeon]